MTKGTTWERIKKTVDGHNSKYDFWLTDSTFNCLLAEAEEVTTKKGYLILTLNGEIIKVRINNYLIHDCEDVHVMLSTLGSYKHLDTVLIKEKTVTVL